MDPKKQVVVGVGIFLLFLALWFGVRAFIPEAQAPDARETAFLYYYDESNDKNSRGTVRCSSRGLVPVTTRIPSGEPIEETLRLLVSGGSADAVGVRGSAQPNFPLPSVVLDSAVLGKDGLLTVIFKDPRHNLSGGSCRVNVLRAQLEATARQFDGVVRVQFLPVGVLEP